MMQEQDINISRHLSKATIFLISDLDGTLISEEHRQDFFSFNHWMETNRSDVVFGIATGRNRQLTKKALKDFDLPSPDILICSAGSELYYRDFVPDIGWESHISYKWKREKLEKILQKFTKIQLQEPEAQGKFKLSYYVNKDFNEDNLTDLSNCIKENHLKANLLLTDNTFLDLLPLRASKGNALIYLSNKWKIPLEQFITAGNGGNDIDMLKGKPKGIVVSNYSPELEFLRKCKDIYFADSPLSTGVLEGIQFYLYHKIPERNKEHR